MAMANMDPILFATTEDPELVRFMQYVAQRAAEKRSREREDLAALVASKVWENW